MYLFTRTYRGLLSPKGPRYSNEPSIFPTSQRAEQIKFQRFDKLIEFNSISKSPQFQLERL